MGGGTVARRRLRRPSSRVQERVGPDSYWTELCQRISRDGQVIPVISNSVRNDRIFAADYEDDGTPVDEDTYARELTIDEELAEVWAEEIGYPMPDKYQLARVAVYNRIKSVDVPQRFEIL